MGVSRHRWIRQELRLTELHPPIDSLRRVHRGAFSVIHRKYRLDPKGGTIMAMLTGCYEYGKPTKIHSIWNHFRATTVPSGCEICEHQ